MRSKGAQHGTARHGPDSTQDPSKSTENRPYQTLPDHTPGCSLWFPNGVPRGAPPGVPPGGFTPRIPSIFVLKIVGNGIPPRLSPGYPPGYPPRWGGRGGRDIKLFVLDQSTTIRLYKFGRCFKLSVPDHSTVNRFFACFFFSLRVSPSRGASTARRTINQKWTRNSLGIDAESA